MNTYTCSFLNTMSKYVHKYKKPTYIHTHMYTYVSIDMHMLKYVSIYIYIFNKKMNKKERTLPPPPPTIPPKSLSQSPSLSRFIIS